ncbi:hypothetical protein E4U51_002411, partial [Claviceps purpurea]
VRTRAALRASAPTPLPLPPSTSPVPTNDEDVLRAVPTGVPSPAPVAPPDPDTPTTVSGTVHPVRGAAIFEAHCAAATPSGSQITSPCAQL